MPRRVLTRPRCGWIVLGAICATLVACSDSGLVPGGDPDEAPSVVPEPDTSPPVSQPTPDATPPFNAGNELLVPDDLFIRDGYGNLDVIRMDVRTNTVAGVCNAQEQSGCTLADVLADINGFDDIKIDIPVRFMGSDYPDDGSLNNAELRQRGATARTAPQKSFRLKLDKGIAKWRQERILQINKHFYDQSRIRNKLSFDLMRPLVDLPSSRTQFVNLWVDDGQGPVDYGLFTHIEKANKQFLKNRNWNTDDRIYKVEYFEFSDSDLKEMQIDDTGEPVDRARFESRLGIENGKDHRRLIAMLEALNDPQQDFVAVLNRYFDSDNILAWVTVNFLLAQKDAITNNFYIYNPAASDKFYILPWDYDSSFYIESVLIDDDISNKQLFKRLNYGYARGSRNVLLDNFYRMPGIHDSVLAKAAELRSDTFSDTTITRLVNAYSDIVRPYKNRAPDVDHLPYDTNQPSQLPTYVGRNYDAMQSDFAIPMPPITLEPRIDGSSVVFSWKPAYDVTGHSLSYDILVSRSVNFSSNDIVYTMTNLPDAQALVSHTVQTAQLPSGTLYLRVIARSLQNPERFWQISKNAHRHEGATLWGMDQFVLP